MQVRNGEKLGSVRADVDADEVEKRAKRSAAAKKAAATRAAEKTDDDEAASAADSSAPASADDSAEKKSEPVKATGLKSALDKSDSKKG